MSGKRDSLNSFVQHTLGNAAIYDAVKLPDNVKIEDWLVSKCQKCFKDVKLVVSVLDGACSETSCPIMKGGTSYEYAWADEFKYPKPVRVTAPKYCELLLGWIDKQLSDKTMFPVDGSAYPADFMSRIKNMFKRMFRVYAHTYHAHRDVFKQNQAEQHLNAVFKHYILVAKEFNLVDDKELVPLADVVTLYVTYQKPTNASGSVNESQQL